MTQDNTIKFRKVLVYRDFGTSAELREGLNGGETLVLSPPTQLVDGSKVQITKPPPAEPEAGKQTASR